MVDFMFSKPLTVLSTAGDAPLRSRIQAALDRALEASGGITLASIRAVAETGVERISTGTMTHSVAALDLSMRCDVA